MNKKIKDISTEELLQQLETAPESSTEGALEEDILSQDKIANFLLKFNIKPGRYKVHKEILFDLYKKYYGFKGVQKIEFNRQLGLYLKIQQQKFFLISREALTIKAESLKLIENEVIDKIKTPTKKRHYENFIKRFNLKAGKIKVPVDCLYFLYDKWCYDNKRLPQYSKPIFARLTGLYFPTRMISHTYHSMMSEEIFEHISKEKIKDYVQEKKTEKRKLRSKIQPKK